MCKIKYISINYKTSLVIKIIKTLCTHILLDTRAAFVFKSFLKVAKEEIVFIRRRRHPLGRN